LLEKGIKLELKVEKVGRFGGMMEEVMEVRGAREVCGERTGGRGDERGGGKWGAVEGGERDEEVRGVGRVVVGSGQDEETGVMQEVAEMRMEGRVRGREESGEGDAVGRGIEGAVVRGMEGERKGKVEEMEGGGAGGLRRRGPRASSALSTVDWSSLWPRSRCSCFLAISAARKKSWELMCRQTVSFLSSSSCRWLVTADITASAYVVVMVSIWYWN
jgi:hypothetical protein